MILSPHIEGTLPLRSSPAAFIQAIRERVASGLLGPNARRSHYAVSESTPEMVRIHAVNWQSAINVGLNELELRFRHLGKIDLFRVADYLKFRLDREVQRLENSRT